MAVLTMDLVCGKRSDPHGVCGSGIILPGGGDGSIVRTG